MLFWDPEVNGTFNNAKFVPSKTHVVKNRIWKKIKYRCCFRVFGNDSASSYLFSGIDKAK